MTTDRRNFLATAGAALTTSMFTGRVRGANDRISLGVIGVGRRGYGVMNSFIREPGTHISAVCDVYQANLETAEAAARSAGHEPKGYIDFREMLVDDSIDAVIIGTPDHWHALMTVEACKAGKDVYVEKPACTFVNEAPKMVEAARKYERVVQGGTNSRSSGHMEAIRDLVRSGRLGVVTSAHVRNLSLQPVTGIGNVPDSEPPPGLDWDLWQGPAPAHPYNQNRFWTVDGSWGAFRYFWDYSGGQQADNGIHIIDLLQMAFDENAPTAVAAMGGNSYLKDARETGDTLATIYQYPEFIMFYEMRYGNRFRGGVDDAILVHGSKATLAFGRGASYRLYADEASPGSPGDWQPGDPTNGSNRTAGGGGGGRGGGGGAQAEEDEGLRPTEERSFEPTETHMANFLDCMRSRERPTADIEYCARSTVTALLGNVSWRAGVRVKWDPETWTSPTTEAHPFMEYHYREPWKLEV